MREDPKAADRRAGGRFLVMSLIRLGGVVVVLLSLLLLNGLLPLPPVAGWIGLALGLVGIFVVPQVLARAWRTPVP